MMRYLLYININVCIYSDYFSKETTDKKKN